MYSEFLAGLGKKDRRKISHIKRLGEELLIADEDFRNAFQKDPVNTANVARLHLASETLDYIQYNVAKNKDFWNYRIPESIPTDAPKDFQLYAQFQYLKGKDFWSWSNYLHEANDGYQHWLMRQSKRLSLELGESHVHCMALHPFTVEVTQGCSVGCWFCGVSAEKLSGVFLSSPDNTKLYKDVLTTLKHVFGRYARGGGLYCATEPFDHPNYEQFAFDFYSVFGSGAQTTTAIAHKDIERTRKFLRFSKTMKAFHNRFSILSLPLLHRIHKAFSPEELMDVSLVVRNSQSLAVTISNAGRAGDSKKKKMRLNNGKVVDIKHAEPSTIACVSGFLINMVNKSIQLVSPTCTSRKWPKGYRVYCEKFFSDGQDFREKINDILKYEMNNDVSSLARISFHRDTTYERLANGFSVVTKYRRRTVCKPLYMGIIGDLIHAGIYSYSELISLCEAKGIDAGEAREKLQFLYDNGLLDDEPTDEVTLMSAAA